MIPKFNPSMSIKLVCILVASLFASGCGAGFASATSTPVPPTLTPVPTATLNPPTETPIPTTGTVEAFLHAEGITMHLCDHAIGDGIGTYIECNGEIDMSAISDSDGHLIIKDVPAGTYYTVFEVPEALFVGSEAPIPCLEGDYHVAQYAPEGGIAICYSGETLGGTVEVVVGETTVYTAIANLATDEP
jgi:hypothetical protein